jgi:hypothetical protein
VQNLLQIKIATASFIQNSNKTATGPKRLRLAAKTRKLPKKGVT